MANFEINGKEYDLKLTYKGIKYLNGVSGSSLETVGKALQGDTDFFPHIIHACLISAGEKYTLKQVEAAIDDALENERLDLLGIMRQSNEIVTDSFFFKALVTKMLADKPEVQKQLNDLLN